MANNAGLHARYKHDRVVTKRKLHLLYTSKLELGRYTQVYMNAVVWDTGMWAVGRGMINRRSTS